MDKDQTLILCKFFLATSPITFFGELGDIRGTRGLGG